jgi:hypothetical protein
MRNFSTCLVLVLALCAQACGSKSEPAAPGKSAKAAPVKKVASPADALSPNLVGAVATSKAGAGLLQVKFEIGARPVVGNPVDIDMVIQPAVDTIDQLSGTIQGDDGLDVVSGEVIPPTEKPAYGTPIHHAVKVLPKRDGIFTLSATMSVDSGGQSLNPVFAFPVIAGNGLSEAAATAAPGPSPAKSAAPAAAH